MISHVGTVSLFVTDQDRAKDFYINKLGFELRTDAPLFPGSSSRWIAVAPKDTATEIILYLPDENWAHYQQVVGKSQALTLSVDNLKTTYLALKTKGVNFVHEPEEQPWGTYAIMEDSEGNRLILSEQPKNA